MVGCKVKRNTCGEHEEMIGLIVKYPVLVLLHVVFLCNIMPLFKVLKIVGAN